MADRERQQHARDAGGGLEPGHDQLRMQVFLLRSAHFRPDAAPLGWSSRNQPGPSCVGSDGETQLRKSLTKAPYRVGLVENQTPSCSGVHKMWNRDGRGAHHRPSGRRTGTDRIRVPGLRVCDQRAFSSRW
jgi:hypothetical protein